MIVLTPESLQLPEQRLMLAMNSCIPYSNDVRSPYTQALNELRKRMKEGEQFMICDDCHGSFEVEQDDGPHYCHCLGGLL